MKWSLSFVQAPACAAIADIRCSEEFFRPERTRDILSQKHCWYNVRLTYDSFVPQHRFVAECTRTLLVVYALFRQKVFKLLRKIHAASVWAYGLNLLSYSNVYYRSELSETGEQIRLRFT